MKILFLSTNNTGRSILAESIARKHAVGNIKIMSGGSHPGDDIHPVAHRVLKDRRYSSTNLVGKSWDQFSSWGPDIVITLCNEVLKQKCPAYVGTSVHVHWGLNDPASKFGNMEDNFIETFNELDARIEKMFTVNMENMDKTALRAHLKGVI